MILTFNGIYVIAHETPSTGAVCRIDHIRVDPLIRTYERWLLDLD